MAKSILRRRNPYGKFAFAAILAITFCMVPPASTAYAKKRKPAKYGTIKVLSTPSGLPIEIDGRREGETTTDYRGFDRDPGVHTLVIILPDGQKWTRQIDLAAGRIKCIALNYRPAPPPVVASPCPYPINLSAPTQVNEGEVITYTADTVYRGNSPLNYIWTVSPDNARIASGAGSPTITVDSTTLAGQRIIATLVVDDGSGNPICRQTAQASTFVPRTPPRESPARQFDVCCSCAPDDQKARLDNLAVELQNDPSTTTYVIAYAGRTSRTGQADLLGARARDYIVTQRGIDRSRIVVLNGGFREEDCVELWLVPRGAAPPLPTPTVQTGDARPSPKTPIRRTARERGRN
jgi:hypothetical protein